jgi:hypothetical protein
MKNTVKKHLKAAQNKSLQNISQNICKVFYGDLKIIKKF